MALRDLENLVHAALSCGLIGPQQRQSLMRGLPMGFVYSLPTVSRPIDQLRFDLMELERTPRLIGLDRPPLAVWLSNAADLTAAQGKAEAARLFAGEADRLAPGGVQARIEAALRRAEPGAVSAAPSAPRAAGQHRANSARPERTHVLTFGSASVDGWRSIDPPINPINVLHVPVPSSDWARTQPPHVGQWRQVNKKLDEELQRLAGVVRPGDGLAVFVSGLPAALVMLAAARIRQHLGPMEPEYFGLMYRRSRPLWQSWGPFEPSGASSESGPPPAGRAHGITPETREVAVVIEAGARVDTDTVDVCLGDVMGRLTLSRPRFGRKGADADTIEQLVDDFAIALDEHIEARPGIRRLHVFFAGPVGLAMRFADELLNIGRTATLYVEQGGHFVPAVEILPGGVASLAQKPIVDAMGDGIYDAFIAYASPDEDFADLLYDALSTDLGLSVFMDRMSLLPGDVWTSEIPAAQARARATIALISAHSGAAWYQSEELINAIRQTRGSAGAHKVIPVLLDGMKPEQLPYGLGRLTPMQVSDGLEPDAAALHITEALRPVFERLTASTEAQGTP